MWTLLVLFWLHQTVSVYAESKLFVRIARVKEEDSLTFYVPRSNELCSLQNVCSNRFNANLSPKASERKHCLMCSCSRQKTATFGVKNGSWQCIDNKEIRQRELAGKLFSAFYMVVYLPSKSLIKFLLTRKTPC